MKWIAHRGYSAKFPENTMLAFENAVLHGSMFLELDVALTKDQKIIVLHDETLDRTTPATGNVSNKSWYEIKDLDAGSWKDPSFSHARIPMLKEVLDCFADEVTINIEIKKEAVHLDEDKSIEPLLMELLTRYRKPHHFQVSSFEPLALHRFFHQMPSIARGYLTYDVLSQQQRQEMQYLQVRAQHVCIEKVTENEVDQAHEMGLEFRTYTVNDIAKLNKAKSLGVDAIFSDHLEGDF